MWVRQNTLWSYDKGRWLPVPVLTGVTDNRETQIVAGATAGQSFVTGVKRRGGVSIKKASLKPVSTTTLAVRMRS